MRNRASQRAVWLGAVLGGLCGGGWLDAAAAAAPEGLLARLPSPRGIAVVLDEKPAETSAWLAQRTELTIYSQHPDRACVDAARRQLDGAGFLGRRAYVECGAWPKIHLGDNLADAVIVGPGAAAAFESAPARAELLRVIHPLGKVLLPDQELTKPAPAGVDDWSHPYHGPDNNPVSVDAQARAPYRTQFLAEPYYVPLPAVTVTSGGRVFKAFGHVGFKERDWPWLNKLAAFNGYNGTLLWTRPLVEGFNVHRNAMVATPQVLYVADDTSCKMLYAATGKLMAEITAPPEASGKVWKWMALSGDTLYALTGEPEYQDRTRRDRLTGAGWPWQPMTAGYDREERSWARGTTLFAVDVRSRQVLWRHEEPQSVDGRAVCLADGRIYAYSHPHYLACRDAQTGQAVWRSDDRALLAAIGEHTKNQIWHRGFSTQCYMMHADGVLLFAGPQRANLVAVAADSGRLLWQQPDGNRQVVARPEGLYALGGSEAVYRQASSQLLNLRTGEVLADLKYHRGNCTRATATADSVFCRVDGNRGTLRLNVADRTLQRFAIMRPDCHAGVIAAGGLLYFGPWMCDCNLSLVGFMALGPAARTTGEVRADPGDRLEVRSQPKTPPAPVTASDGPLPGDWPTYRADNVRSSSLPLAIADQVRAVWQLPAGTLHDPTAPITCRGQVYVAGGDGTVAGFNLDDGKRRWRAYTGGRVFFPPAEHAGRLYVGSGDGYVYALDRESGEVIWRFRAAPVERRIPVYGRLMSPWPVASGVLADGGTLYAAAGIASYDGTHVYALDAATGKIRWQNSRSGQLAPGAGNPGVSVQGHLLLHDGVLYLAGGSAVSPARFDTKSGRCLNEVDDPLSTAPRGRDLFVAGGQVVAYDRILYAPKRYWQGHFYTGPLCQAQAGDVTVRGGEKLIARIDPATSGRWTTDLWHTEVPPKLLWQSDRFALAQAVVLGKNAAVFAGQLKPEGGGAEPRYALAAFANADGRLLWVEPLPAMPVPFGLATDAEGRLLVTTDDGRLLCYAGKPQEGR